MDRDPFGHRKYHGLYFILGFLIAFVAFMMLTGCEQAKSTAGVEVVEEIEKDEFVIITDDRACTGWNCNGPTDPPGCWYPGNTQYCDKPVMCCMALMPTCMACQDGCTVDAWLEKTCGSNATDAEYAGWDEDNNEAIWLCQATIIN
jgi:hypothetical protein